MPAKQKKFKKLRRLIKRASIVQRRAMNYWNGGVWTDSRNKLWVNIAKTLNITVRSFLNADVQGQACALTYRTVLAIVPALAMLFAIGRGFGFQNLLADELYTIMPAQHQAINAVLAFADSYLNQSGEGVFVGVGLVFLLWTLISLVSNVEDTFNSIWGVSSGRSMWRKITDYTAMLLILPVLMVCSSGISLLLSSALRIAFSLPIFTPLVSFFLEAASWVFTWLFFAAVFMLIPNTKVQFKNALLAGVAAGTGFRVLEWLFVTGQVYVTRYNAIYGSFSFVPLLLIWLQLTWVIILTGSLLCYSSQNIFQFSFSDQIRDISNNYRIKAAVALMAIVVNRFDRQKQPLTLEDITTGYGLPSRLVSTLADNLEECGLLSKVVIDSKHEIYGLQPAIPSADITVGLVKDRMNNMGATDFLPDFATRFTAVNKAVDSRDYDTLVGSLTPASLKYIRKHH